ncbi:N-6 DNA methylase [Bacillus cereus]|nr:N-6 DNA methylase [Bacillus cereus]
MTIQLKDNNLTNLIEKLSIEKNNNTTDREKKLRGQFFTSASVAKFMASMAKLNLKNLKVLDPGSGTGILIAALVERILNENLNINLTVDLYENDSKAIPFLYKSMELCSKKMKERNNSFEYNIKEVDFILSNESLFNGTSENNNSYDLVISNPPYFKVNKKHQYSTILKDYIFGQPNVYFMFMAVSEKLLNLSGQIIFLTPRSYCSGPYFRKFRLLFFNSIQPQHFHLFESRKNTFTSENVLQENIILSGYKKRYFQKIKVSSSNTPDIYKSYTENKFPKKLIMCGTDNRIIRLPTSKIEQEILQLFDSWENNFKKMDMLISTGPVVTFRAKDVIKEFNPQMTYPLLYMRHVDDTGHIRFPLNKKEDGILKSHISSILIPTKNYVIIKRFSSKEQNKRIYASAFLKKEFNYEKIGLENHLNYIYKVHGELSEIEVTGLVSFLNSKLVNEFFCIINGHTQVNASDLKQMNLPDRPFLLQLGEIIIENTLSKNCIDNYILQTFFKKKDVPIY